MHRSVAARTVRRQIAHTVPDKPDRAGHRLRRGSADGRPPGLDRGPCRRRHKAECRTGPPKQDRSVVTRYGELAGRRDSLMRAGVPCRTRQPLAGISPSGCVYEL
nr:hypothetical protein KitaXyl93_05720 [Kitasatospora sp. Xyl93]